MRMPSRYLVINPPKPENVEGYAREDEKEEESGKKTVIQNRPSPAGGALYRSFRTPFHGKKRSVVVKIVTDQNHVVYIPASETSYPSAV